MHREHAAHDNLSVRQYALQGLTSFHPEALARESFEVTDEEGVVHTSTRYCRAAAAMYVKILQEMTAIQRTGAKAFVRRGLESASMLRTCLNCDRLELASASRREITAWRSDRAPAQRNHSSQGLPLGILDADKHQGPWMFNRKFCKCIALIVRLQCDQVYLMMWSRS